MTSTCFCIQLNGSLAGFFQGGRGLRQGDPMSPLLFVLAMEYPSRHIQKASTTQGFGFHPNCRNLKLARLMFADDLILFCKPNTHSLTGALHKFSQSSSLVANQSKSLVVMETVVSLQDNKSSQPLDLLNECPHSDI